MDKLVIESFNKYVEVNNENKCWGWTASLSTHGYGQLHIKGKTYRAHRVSYEIFNGKIPKNTFICHKCNNPICCNPKHLYAGNAFTNTQDKIAAGVLYSIPPRRGKDNNKTKLSEKKVSKIRVQIRKGISQRELAEKYKVTQSCINAIKVGKSWKHTIKDENDLLLNNKKGNTKLSEKDVLKIRALTIKNTEIAKQFSISPSTVGKIKKHILWSHI